MPKIRLCKTGKTVDVKADEYRFTFPDETEGKFFILRNKNISLDNLSEDEIEAKIYDHLKREIRDRYPKSDTTPTMGSIFQQAVKETEKKLSWLADSEKRDRKKWMKKNVFVMQNPEIGIVISLPIKVKREDFDV